MYHEVILGELVRLKFIYAGRSSIVQMAKENGGKFKYVDKCMSAAILTDNIAWSHAAVGLQMRVGCLFSVSFILKSSIVIP